MSGEVWLVIEMGEVDASDTVVGVYASEASADAERDKRMVRIPDLPAWNTCFIERFEVKP